MRIAISAFAVLCAAVVLSGLAAAQGVPTVVPTAAPTVPQLPQRWNASIGQYGGTNFRIRRIGDHTVLVGVRGYDVNTTLKAYRVNDGTALWSQPLTSDTGFTESIVIAGSDHFGAFVAPGNAATVVDATGTMAWGLQLPSSAKPESIAVSAAATAADVTIAVVTSEALTVARGGRIVREIAGTWGANTVINTAADVAVATQILNVGGSDSCIIALNLTTGQLLWNVSSPGAALSEGATWADDMFVAATTYSGAQLYALSNGELISNVSFPQSTGQVVSDAVAGPSSMLYVSTLDMNFVLERHPELHRIKCPKKRVAAARAVVKAKGTNAYPMTLSAWSSSTSQMWSFFTGSTMTNIGVSLDRLLVGVCTSQRFVILDGLAGTQVGAVGPLQDYDASDRPLFLGQSAFFTGALDFQTMSLVAVDAVDNNRR